MGVVYQGLVPLKPGVYETPIATRCEKTPEDEFEDIFEIVLRSVVSLTWLTRSSPGFFSSGSTFLRRFEQVRKHTVS